MFPLMETEGESLGLQHRSEGKTFNSGGQLFILPRCTKEERSKVSFPWFPELSLADGSIVKQICIKCDAGGLFKTHRQLSLPAPS